MIAPAQDAEALEAHTKAMQYEKMLREQKLNQEQAAAAKAQAEQLEFQKQKMKLELENQKQITLWGSQTSCHTCKGKHHTSICEKTQMLLPACEPGMTANHVGESAVIHPVVVLRVEGYKFRALLDGGASHSYCSSTFLKLVKARPNTAGLRQIAMLMGVTTKTLQEFNVTMHAVT
ncbi:unnamed protein product, partial [Porites evermanni]